jgi:amino acid transporter
MENAQDNPAPGLRSGALSGRALYAATVGIIVATGSLALNGVGMGTAGPAFILALLVAYGLALINSTVFSELGTTYPKAGSILVYVSNAFGTSLGTAAALCYAIGLVLACSAECTVIGRLLEHTIPGMPWWMWSLVLITFVMAVNLGSVDFFGKFQIVCVVIMLGSQLLFPLLAFGGLGRQPVRMSAFTPLLRTSWTDLFSLVIIAYFLFAGFEMACPLVEEARNPSKNLPRAMIGAVSTVILTTTLMGLAFLAYIPADQLAGLEYPHMLMGQAVMGEAGKWWWLIVSLSASSSAISAAYAVVPRLLYGMAQEGSLPKIFGYLQPRYQAPWVGLFACYAFTLVFGIVRPGWKFLFAVAAFAWISTYVLVVAAAIRLRWSDPQTPRPFRMPLFPLLPALGLTGMVLVLLFSGIDTLRAGGSIFFGCFLYGVLVARKKTRRTV